TERNMALAIDAAERRCGTSVDERFIWKSMRNKDLSRSFRHFVWLAMHEGYFIGKKWKHTNKPEREICEECDMQELMEHILLKCKSNGREAIWKMAKKLWERATNSPLVVSWGDILTCGLRSTSNDDDAESKGDDRLRRILISESAHLIWKIRNNRTINGKRASIAEVKNRWIYAIINRRRIEFLTSDMSRYGRKALRGATVRYTWRNTSLSGLSIELDRTSLTEVLGSIT
ncbi:hypothetical protein CYLTODRAFT_363821, partial [Cylindrobasidium torrendii FP15055 ss-10]